MEILKKSSSLYFKSSTTPKQQALKSKPAEHHSKLELKGKENIRLVAKLDKKHSAKSVHKQERQPLDLVDKKLAELGIRHGMPLASCKASMQIGRMFKKQSACLITDTNQSDRSNYQTFEDAKKKIKSLKAESLATKNLSKGRAQPLQILVPSTPVRTVMQSCQSVRNVNMGFIKDKLLGQYDFIKKPAIDNYFKEKKQKQNSAQKIKKSQSQSTHWLKDREKDKDRPHKNQKVEKYIDAFRKNIREDSKSKTPRYKEHPLNQLSIKRFKIGKKLGKGRFGQVYTAKDTLSGMMLAIKQVSKENLIESDMISQLQQQIKIQSFVRHPNILRMFGFFSDKQNIYMLLQLAQGNVFRQLRIKSFPYKKRFSQQKAALYLRQMIEALLFLHKEGVIHRDIKPQNILRCQGTIKLSDFGWSVYSPESQRKTFCGTLDYVSPDIVLGKKYDFKVDVWSIGVLCYEFCIGRAPFESKQSQEQVYEKILMTKYDFPEFLSSGAKEFISKILIREASKRMSLEEALQSRWLQENSKHGFVLERNVYNDFTQILK